MSFMEKNKDTTEIDSNKSKDDEKTAEQIESDRNDIGLERTYRQKEIKQKISIFLSRNFKWLLLTWLLLIFLVGIFFFIWPEYKIIRSLNKVTREQKENEYTKNKEYLYEIENLISVYRKIDKVDIEKIDLLLPLNNIQEELFPKLKEIVTINGLILESLSIKGEGNDSSRGIITLPDSENNDLTDKASLPEKVGKIKFI